MVDFQFLADDLVKRIDNAIGLDAGDMVLLYGSAAGGKTTSDFDCCIIKQNYTPEDLNKAVEAVIAFHRENGLRLDDEVPHHNKLMYSQRELFETVTQTPFSRNSDGSVNIDPIEKNPQFLASPQIKKRLLLNLMTTHSVILAGDKKKFEFYKHKAWDSLSKFMFAYQDNQPLSPAEFVENLYTDKYTQKSGEDFLGYKSERPAVAQYLRRNSLEYFTKQVASGQMKKTADGRFCFREDVLRNFTKLLPEKTSAQRNLVMPFINAQKQR